MLRDHSVEGTKPRYEGPEAEFPALEAFRPENARTSCVKDFHAMVQSSSDSREGYRIVCRRIILVAPEVEGETVPLELRGWVQYERSTWGHTKR